MSTTALAATELFRGFPVIKLLVNGRTVRTATPAIAIDGEVMVPLTAISEALGVTATNNQVDGTVDIITTGDERLTALTNDNVALRNKVLGLEAELKALRDKMGDETKVVPPATDIGRSRTNPAPVGTEVYTSLELNTAAGKLPFALTYKVTEVIRGDAALQRVKAANQFNSDPKPGQEYLLVKLSYKLVAIQDAEAAIEVSEYWFTAVSGSGKDYPRTITVDPTPDVNARLYKGASHEGWMSFMVDKADTNPLMVLARDSQGKSGYWFALKPAPANSAPSPAASVQPPAPPSSTTAPSTIKTGADLERHLNTLLPTVDTKLGQLKIRYEVTHNDRTYFPFDYWIRMVYEPSSYFLDMTTKVGITAEDKAASLSVLRDHARKVHNVAAGAFPGAKITGSYYRSWYQYPSLQVGFEARRALTWQNYDDNLLGAGDPYARATLSSFRFEPSWDDYDL